MVEDNYQKKVATLGIILLFVFCIYGFTSMTSWRIPHGFESNPNPIPMGPKRIAVNNNGLSGIDNNILFVPKKAWGSHADVGRYIESAVFGITGGLKPSTVVKSAKGLVRSLKKVHTLHQIRKIKNLRLPAKYESIKTHMLNNSSKKLQSLKSQIKDVRLGNYEYLNGSGPDKNRLLKTFLSGVTKSRGPAKNFKKQVNNFATRKAIKTAEEIQKYLGLENRYNNGKRLFAKAFSKPVHSNLTGNASSTAAIQASKRKKRVGYKRY